MSDPTSLGSADVPASNFRRPVVKDCRDEPLQWLLLYLLAFPIVLALWLVLFLPVILWVVCCAVLESVTQRTFWWGPTS
jgi:hypothetical protein